MPDKPRCRRRPRIEALRGRSRGGSGRSLASLYRSQVDHPLLALLFFNQNGDRCRVLADSAYDVDCTERPATAFAIVSDHRPSSHVVGCTRRAATGVVAYGGHRSSTYFVGCTTSAATGDAASDSRWSCRAVPCLP